MKLPKMQDGTKTKEYKQATKRLLFKQSKDRAKDKEALTIALCCMVLIEHKNEQEFKKKMSKKFINAMIRIEEMLGRLKE